MLLRVKIKLKSPFLGNCRTTDKIRRFDRSKAFKHDIQVDMVRWNWAIEEAIEALGMDLDPSAVRVTPNYKAPKLELYVRRWRDGKTGKQKEEMFESIKSGAVLTIDVLVINNKEPEGSNADDVFKKPTKEDLKDILSLVGRMLGLSPWGSKFGYGRFEVLAITPASK